MLPGISTACLYPMNTEESLQTLSALRPACMEVFLNAEQELKPAFLQELRARADTAGTKIVTVHPYSSAVEPMLFFSSYARRFEDGLALYRRFYQAAKILGADCVVFHGDYKFSPLPREEYFSRFARVWKEAREHGISLCQENVDRCVSHSVHFLTEMRQALPQVEYILDVKQAVRAGESVWEVARAMGEKIKHVHISDHNESESCLPPGQGVLNIGDLLSAIAKNASCESAIVELYGENFGDIVELSASFQHLCTVVSTRS